MSDRSPSPDLLVRTLEPQRFSSDAHHASVRDVLLVPAFAAQPSSASVDVGLYSWKLIIVADYPKKAVGSRQITLGQDRPRRCNPPASVDPHYYISVVGRLRVDHEGTCVLLNGYFR